MFWSCCLYASLLTSRFQRSRTCHNCVFDSYRNYRPNMTQHIKYILNTFKYIFNAYQHIFMIFHDISDVSSPSLFATNNLPACTAHSTAPGMFQLAPGPGCGVRPQGMGIGARPGCPLVGTWTSETYRNMGFQRKCLGNCCIFDLKHSFHTLILLAKAKYKGKQEPLELKQKLKLSATHLVSSGNAWYPVPKNE